MIGFVYIWRDRKHNRYYVGSHWGRMDDGYVCSSAWMKRAYNRRPEDFKRRILEVVDDHSVLREKEHRWLQMIKKEELSTKYYNLRNHHFGHWSTSDEKKAAVLKKISEGCKGKTPKFKDPGARKKKISETLKVYNSRGRTEEHRRNLAAAGIGRKATEETRKKMSKSRLGKKHSIEARLKMQQAALRRYA